MPIPPAGSKYTLKSLHQEIDLFDRKLAHMERFDLSPAGPKRAAAERLLRQKRSAAEKRALQLAAEGVPFAESERPRSFRP